MTKLYFAQISDIHISSLGDHHDLLSGRSAGFLADIITKLNLIEELDFLLITGDLFDLANKQEFEQFQQVITNLQKPYYIIPGNHDRHPPEISEGLTRHEFAHHFNPQINDRPTAPQAQAGYWSITVKPDIQLIGLDSNRDQNWGGIIDNQQLEWLKRELATHTNKLIILAVHHPLHPLSPIDDEPDWSNFVCDNGSKIMALLDNHPQVKIVLTGHHHLTSADKTGQIKERLHLACPALCIYPCAYRTLKVERQQDNNWQIEWQTHPATDEKTIKEAYKLAFESWMSVGFEADFVELHTQLALGNKEDRHGTTIL